MAAPGVCGTHPAIGGIQATPGVALPLGSITHSAGAVQQEVLWVHRPLLTARGINAWPLSTISHPAGHQSERTQRGLWGGLGSQCCACNQTPCRPRSPQPRAPSRRAPGHGAPEASDAEV